MNKARLREIYQQKRQELSEEEVEQLSQQICNRFFEYARLEKVRHIHIFLPIARQKEVNTWLIIRRLQKEFPETGIVVSETKWDDRKMENFHLLPDTQLKESSLGIPEPVNAPACPVEKIDLVLLPLLAFDLEGNRLGYGAGFYDRFLASCQPEVPKIGLSLFEPLSEKIDDAQEHDIPLDACICPHRVYSFK